MARKNPPRRSRTERGAIDRYLHALLLLTDDGRQADTGDLAVKVGVSAAAASQMLRKLARSGLVKLVPYQGAELTTEGLHRALRIVRRHRLVEVFLHKVLGFDLDEIHARALLVQPVVDEAFEEKLDALLGHPTIDPHGRPIPGKNATWPKLGDVPVPLLTTGSAGVVSRIVTDDRAVLEYLEGLGIAPGARLALVGVAPFDGPISVRVAEKEVHLGRALAHAVYVEDDRQGSAGATPSRPRGTKSTGGL
jgi:DtxR family Mn-dependent transcriptional regulator